MHKPVEIAIEAGRKLTPDTSPEEALFVLGRKMQTCALRETLDREEIKDVCTRILLWHMISESSNSRLVLNITQELAQLSGWYIKPKNTADDTKPAPESDSDDFAKLHAKARAEINRK